MSSIKPNDGGCEVDGAEKVARGFVVASCEGAILLELGEEIFNQMPRLIEVLVVAAGSLAVSLGRDDQLLSRRSDWIDHPVVGVEGFVGDQHVGLHRWDQVIGADEVMRLAAGQMEADRVAEGIDQGVDLGAQPAARTPDGLVLTGFFFAPALCWWHRTMVLSIIAYSLSASSERCWKTRFQTPDFAQRLNRRCTFFQSLKRSGRSRQGIPAR